MGVGRLSRVAAVFGVLSALLVASASPARAHDDFDLPPGFVATTVAAGFPATTGVEIGPDGRVYVTLQNGVIRVVENDVLRPTPLITVPTLSTGGEGLFGLTFDPDFETNGYFYVFRTTGSFSTNPVTARNRVTRYRAINGVASPTTGLDLFVTDRIQNVPANHHGGDLHFGTDGMLYISTGNNTEPPTAQSFESTFGKILRIAPDGSIPTDNPFYNQLSGQFRAIYALGLRNPFKFEVEPVTGRMYFNDVGPNDWEEINEIVPAGNYGSPIISGPGAVPGFEEPVFAYPHTDNGAVWGCAVMGGAFYNPPTATFGPEYVNDYFFADFCNGWVDVLDTATGAVTQFGQFDSIVDIDVADDGSMYVLNRFHGGQLIKIQRVADTGAPRVTAQPVDVDVVAGTPVSFTIAVTGDAPIGVQWQRDGVDIPGAQALTYGFTPTLADDGATFRAVVSNAIGSTASSIATLRVGAGGGTPEPVIDPGVALQTYGGGDTIWYAGSASDPEDGPLGPASLTWIVDFHHNVHTHPVFPATSGQTSGEIEVATQGETDTDVWFRITLIAEDSDGNRRSTYADVHPRLTTVTLDSEPSGLVVTLDGTPRTTPVVFDAVEGLERSIGVISPQIASGTSYEFVSWSDGDAPSHTYTIPVDDAALLATFREGSGSGATAPTVTRHPVDQLVGLGASATFSVEATGTAPLRYQWQREGVDIPGATSASYTTPPVGIEDDFAAYRVLVGNAAGTVASSSATLRLGDPRITDGLTGLWTFDERSGDSVLDRSGVGVPLDLTIRGPGASWDPAGGLLLDGNALVASPGPATKLIDASLATDEITIEAWIEPAAGAPTKSGRIAGITAVSGEGRNVVLSQGFVATPARTYEARVRTAASYGNALGTVPGSVAASLTHVVFTRSASGATTIFLDGVVAATGVTTGSFVWDPGHVFNIGNDGSRTRPFRGTVHLVATYARALSPADVAANLAAGVQHLPPPPVPASIVTPPSSTSGAPGSTVTLTVVAAGSAPLAYQWERGGVPIPGADGPELVVGPLTPADDGTQYRVRVSNTVGSELSAPATIVVTAPSARVTQGLLALYDFDEPGGAVVRDVSGVSPALDLTIADPARVTRLPGNGLALDAFVRIESAGPAAKITSAVAATGAMTVEAWVQPAVPNSATPGNIVGIQNASSRNFVLSQGFVSGNPTTSVQTRLRTSGSYGNALGTGAGVLDGGLTHLVFTRSATGQTLLYVDGSPAASGTSPGTIAWDGALPLMIGSNGQVGKQFRGAVHLVAFYDRALSPVDVVRNLEAGPAGSPPAPMAPTISAEPADATVAEGDDAVFAVTADGTAPLTYQWYRDGEAIPGAVARVLTVADVSIADDDGAVFRVEVTNPLGTETSDVAVLTVVPDSGPPALLFVTSTVGPVAPDQVVLDHLRTLGYEVFAVDDDEVATYDARGVDAILISTSVDPAAVGAKFATIDIPVVTWEPLLYEPMGLATGGRETSAKSNRVIVVDPTHPVAAGFTGSVFVGSVTARQSVGTPAPGGRVVATAPSGEASVVAIDTGTALLAGQAPARRVLLYFDYQAPKWANAKGLAILGAAVSWAVAG